MKMMGPQPELGPRSKMYPPTNLSLKLIVLSVLIVSSSLSTLVLATTNQDGGGSTIKTTNKKQTDEQSAILNYANRGESAEKQQVAEDLNQSASSSRGQLLGTPSTSPSSAITSVHQVWTSASSGSLDELSPEIIGKLRGDVPFLAAYALRPRLVGGLMSHQSAESSKVASHSSEAATSDQPAFETSVAPASGQHQTNAGLMLETGASSPRGATEPSSLVPKLGDFSEFRVETSSSSKSEHHHKRKTSLKKKGAEGDLRAKKRVLAEASQLLKKRRRRRNNNNRFARTKNQANRRKKSSRRRRKPSTGHNGVSKSKRRDALTRSQVRAGRLRTKLNRRNLQHHMNIIRHGRYFQEPDAAGLANDLDGDDGEARDLGATKGGESTAVKGGSRAAGKKPFYSKALPGSGVGGEMDKPSISDDTENDENQSEPNDTVVPEMTTPKGQLPESGKDGADGKTANEVDDDDAELDELPEPKRVGDGDVDEEEGDTVTVMPKSDGVDDDPELPDYEDERAAQAPGEPATGKGDDDQAGPEQRESESDEPRIKRINREKANKPHNGQPSSSDGEDEDDSSSSSVGGGGIGATVGNGATGGSDGSGHSLGGEPDVSPDSGDDADDDDASTSSGRGKVTPGVEFANDEDEDDRRKGSSANADRDSGNTGSDDGDDNDTRRDTDSPNVDQTRDERPEDFESKKEKSGGRKTAAEAADDDEDKSRSSGDSPTRGSDDDEPRVSSKPAVDVDYRDDTVDSDRKGSPKESSGGRDLEKETRHEKPESKDCDDGSYNHDDDHHHGHHDHHDSIKWLQDAIPGEPNDDYPILSRPNVTNFSCSDQKYPGYYADVEARCQVFHICQADGRQDSFLCPNGTIFSQKTYVCVWWNSFDCEEAPKYYDLNALLYKSSSNNNNNRGSTDLRPLDGERIGSSRGEDEESSIDSLIRSMRRNKGRPNQDGAGLTNEAGARRAMADSGIGLEDEATIQRKDDPGASARLRASRAEPRRKRRASVKQVARKLRPRPSGFKKRVVVVYDKPKRRA